MFSAVNRSRKGNYVAILSLGNIYLTWEPGQPYWQPHNRNVARRIQSMGWRTDGGLRLLVRGAGLYLSKGTGITEVFDEVAVQSRGFGVLAVGYRSQLTAAPYTDTIDLLLLLLAQQTNLGHPHSLVINETSLLTLSSKCSATDCQFNLSTMLGFPSEMDCLLGALSIGVILDASSSFPFCKRCCQLWDELSTNMLYI
ncbi:hypothetical protein ACH5RR_029656 [Cinchona calisaya]|uniref:Photosynthesis system II assembly factor Ycf48/Hcf136-like domain-containing protein n=1 Tax=Cinchona calisaya TaxID=153742 RepID=A0ABD2YVV1_9GENT